MIFISLEIGAFPECTTNDITLDGQREKKKKKEKRDGNEEEKTERE